MHRIRNTENTKEQRKKHTKKIHTNSLTHTHTQKKKLTKMLCARRLYTVLLLQSILLFSAVIGIRWEHSVDLNDDYRVLWTISKLPSMSQQQQQLLAHTQQQQLQQQQHQQQSYLPHLTEITFEIQVRTLGYIGFGFSPDGQRAGSDLVIGWVSDGKTYFHVSSFSTSFSSFLFHLITNRCLRNATKPPRYTLHYT